MKPTLVRSCLLVIVIGFAGAASAQADTPVNGFISTDTTWATSGSPYIVSGSIIVGNDATLTIQPGVEVRFDANAQFVLGTQGKATLIARGTAAAPIRFTANSSSTAPGQWDGIQFHPNSSAASVLEYCTIEYAGQPSFGGVQIYGARPTIRYSTIRKSAGPGVRLDSASAVIEFTSLTENQSALYVTGINGNTRLRWNTITGNSAFLSNTTFLALDARLNWWGSAQGPSGIIATDAVVEPWLTQPPSGTLQWTTAAAAPAGFNPNGAAESFYGMLTETGAWTITLRDAGGAVVRTLTGTTPAASIDWNGRNAANLVVPNGVYTYEMTASAAGVAKTAAPARGHVTVDASLPLANLTAPIPEQAMVPQIVTIRGTAGGAGFQSYRLGYGEGYSPWTWTLIRAATVPVTNNVLSTVNLTAITSPMVTIRLTVLSTAGQATDQATVRLIRVTDLADAPDPFSPNGDGQAERTAMSVASSWASNWTLTIRNSAAAVVRTFTLNDSSGMGQTWDGKNAAGVLQASGVYTYQFTAKELISGLAVNSAVGQTSLDRTSPTAVISAPTQNKIFLTDAPIVLTGTATDTNFDRYTLEWGSGSAPGSFVFVLESRTKVAGTALGTVNVQGWSPGTYTFRLRVYDKAGLFSEAQRTIILDHIQITNVYLDSYSVDPFLGGRAVVHYQLSKTAHVTARFYNSTTKALVRTLTLAGQPPGNNTLQWDGRNAAAAVAPLDVYYFTLEAVDPTNVNRKGTYNNATTPKMGGGSGYLGASMNRTDLNAFKSEAIEIKYSLIAPGGVSIFVQQPSGAIIRTLANNAIRSGGDEIEIWDGRKDDGKIYTGSFQVFLSEPTATFENMVRLLGSPPVCEGFQAEAYVIQPIDGEVSTMRYTLSRAANVTVTLTDPNGSTVRTLLSNVSQGAGAQVLEWDGRNTLGRVVAVEGNYKVTLTAADPSWPTNTSTRNGTVLVYR